ncbi:MAG: helix-turn-helix domain-containing protein [Acidimicrobiales bacterium]
MENPEDDIDELEADIDADEERQPGYRQLLENLLPVIRLTTALWQERERLGLTVDEVAARSGLQMAEVEAIDNNDVDVPVEIMARYAAAVGFRLDLQPLSA